jgi:nucleotide-binding universal stress UspA family protein
MIASMEQVVEHTLARKSPPSLSEAGNGTSGAGETARTPDGIHRLLLATDLSAASERAADEAILLAVESGAQLVVLSVIDPGRLRLPGGRILRRVDQERSRIEIGVQMVVGRALAAGARAAFLVWEGDPAEAILAASEAENVDVIVLGSRRRGLLGRLILGSTSARVSEQAQRRVLVVPRYPS